MNTKAFIKVTPKGETKSHILPAGNSSFYTSQGASITTPTEEEILAAYPELAERKRPVSAKKKVYTAEEVAEIFADCESKLAEKNERIAELEVENTELQTRIDELDKKLADMIAEAEEALKENEEATEEADVKEGEGEVPATEEGDVPAKAKKSKG